MIWIWQICKNMHPHFADGAFKLAAASGCRSDSDGCYSSPAAAILQWHPLLLRLPGYPRITQSENIILTYPWLCKSGYLIPTYPWICKSKHLIPSHPISIYKIYAWISRDILTFPGCCFSRCYEAARPSFFLGFREIREKRSHWPGGQSAPSCQARQPKISLHLDTTSWQFNLALKHHLLGDSNCCIWFSFTLGLQCHAQVTRLRQMFEMSHADLKQWRAQPPHFIRSGQHLRGQHFVYLLL